MISLIAQRLNDPGEDIPDSSHHVEELRSSSEDVSDESDSLEEQIDIGTQYKALSISPATLANALEKYDIHNRHHLDSVMLNEFLTDILQKEYAWKLSKQDIKYFTTKVKKYIAVNSGGTIPQHINKELLIESIPSEQNFLIQIGHKVQSSTFMKFWQNYDVDFSGYIEMEELKSLVLDYARIACEEPNESHIKHTINTLMLNLDTNKDGKIELEELSKIMNVEDNFMKNFCGRNHLNRKDFNKIFSHYDSNGDKHCLDENEVMALINDILKHLETQGKNVPVPLLKNTYDQVMKICDVNNSRSVQKHELALLLSCFD